MDKKTLLAAATRKLDRQPAGSSGSGADTPDPGRRVEPGSPSDHRTERVVSKGITLRPRNLEKLDTLELSLRQRGIKAGHSGLIQIAVDRLVDNGQLADDYRDLLKMDLRLK